MARETMEVTVFPIIDWSNLLAVVPTEQLEAEVERREREGRSEALPES